MPLHSLLSRLRRAEEALPRPIIDLNELSSSELHCLERYMRRAQKVGADAALSEMSRASRLEFEGVASKVKYEWSG